MSLREGSVHEEEALVEALREIVVTVDSLQDDMRTLLPMLVQYGHTQDAQELQTRMVGLLAMAGSGLERVWPSGGGAEILGPADIQVSITVGA